MRLCRSPWVSGVGSLGGARGKTDSKAKTRKMLAGPGKAETPISRLRGPAVPSPQEGWTLGNGTLSRGPACSAKPNSGCHPLHGGHECEERRSEISMMDCNSPEGGGNPNHHGD